MSNTFYRKPIEGGDQDGWAPFAEAFMEIAIGEITCNLYYENGKIKISKGRIGIDNGSLKGSIIVDTIVSLDFSAIGLDNWAKIEVSVSGTVPTFTIEEIVGATDRTAVPTEYTGAFDLEKGGYYLSSTKRCIGLYYRAGVSSSRYGIIVQKDHGKEGYKGVLDLYGGGGGHFAFAEVEEDYTYHIRTTDSFAMTKKVRVICTIPGWDMPTDASKVIDIYYDVDKWSQVIFIDAYIIDDGQTLAYSINHNINTTGATFTNVDTVNNRVTLTRGATSIFISPNYNDDSIVRGWVIIDIIQELPKDIGI